MVEIIFEVAEDEIEEGYSTLAPSFGIHTEDDSLEKAGHDV